MRINGLPLDEEKSELRKIIVANSGYKWILKCKPQKTCRWTKPELGEFKLSLDASLDENSGGLGGIIRNDEGMAITIFSTNTPSEEIFELELTAIRMGINRAQEMNIKRLRIEDNSLLVVNIIQGLSPIPWKKHMMVHQILETLKEFEAWRISHTWREADYLSKRNYICKGLNFPLPLATLELLEIINSDRSGFEYIRM
ncbi:uncharacterized protein LOC143867967 [Tasmannia lanceolata]|uniref:uncharacterized protein LOC143867967 n=1 Tax=Tasmannia lanceolata TaxID=3420 RepID=UPI004063DF6B